MSLKILPLSLNYLDKILSSLHLKKKSTACFKCFDRSGFAYVRKAGAGIRMGSGRGRLLQEGREHLGKKVQEKDEGIVDTSLSYTYFKRLSLTFKRIGKLANFHLIFSVLLITFGSSNWVLSGHRINFPHFFGLSPEERTNYHLAFCPASELLGKMIKQKCQ